MTDTDTKDTIEQKACTVADVQRALQEGFNRGWKAGCQKIVGFFTRELEEAHKQGIEHEKCFMPVADVALAVLHISEKPPTLDIKVEASKTEGATAVAKEVS